MNIKKIVEDYKRNLYLVKDEERKEKQEKYLNNEIEFIGVKKSDLNPYMKEFNKTNKDLSVEEKIELVYELYNQHLRELQYTAIEFLNKFIKKIDDESAFKILDDLSRIDPYWETIDTLDAMFSDYWVKQTLSKKKLMISTWIGSDDIWQQRIGIQIQLDLKEDIDMELLELTLAPVIETKNFFLQRSIAWQLRNAHRYFPNKTDDLINKLNTSKKIITIMNNHPIDK